MAAYVERVSSASRSKSVSFTRGMKSRLLRRFGPVNGLPAVPGHRRARTGETLAGDQEVLVADRLVEVVQERPADAHAVVADRPDVGSRHRADEVHLRRPRTDPPHRDDVANDLLVAHASVA